MWDRVVFKDRAKAIMKDHYWKVFIACIIASLLGATSSEGGSGLNVEFNSETVGQLDLGLGMFNFEIPFSRFSLTLGFMVVVLMILAIVSAVVLGAFVFSVLRVGFCRYLVLTQQHGHPAEIGEIFWGFGCGHYINLVKTMFFHDLYIFLWGCCLLSPAS